MKKLIIMVLNIPIVLHSACLEQSLIRAIKMERVGEVRRYLNQGAHVNYQDDEGNTPLIYAAWEGKPRIIQLLLDHGASIDQANNKQQTPLMIATMGKKRCAITMLLEQGANVNAQDRNGNTAPMLATFIEWPKVSRDIASLFLKPKYTPDLTLKNNDGDTFLTLAVYTERYYLVESIINYINKYHAQQRSMIINQQNNEKKSPLLLATELFSNCLAMLLLDNGADIEAENEYGNTPLMIAALKHNIVLINRLLAMNANIDHQNCRGYTALMFAASQGKESIIKTLTCHNADKTLTNCHGETACAIVQRKKYRELSIYLQ